MSIYEGCRFSKYFDEERGRFYINIYFPDGSRVHTSYARYKMQEHLDRFLDPDKETVDHIDEDKTNDELGNLRLLTRSENTKARHKGTKWYTFFCPVCDEECSIPMKRYRDNQVKQGNSGPYCSRSCSAKYTKNRSRN